VTTRKTAAEEASSRYEILYDDQACKVLDKLSATEYQRLDEKIVGLAVNPRPHGYRQLHPQVFRVRVGDWRIIYVVDDAAKRVIISQVKRRGKDTYKKL
jgi:mRNA interferase RelE/StbE